MSGTRRYSAGRSDRVGQRLAWALLVSVAVHLVLAFPLHAIVTRPVETAEPRQPMATEAVPILSEEEVDRLIAMAQPAPPAKKKPEEEKKPEKEEEKEKNPELPDGQVVEIPPPPREEAPEDARLLSDYDSKVEREMVAARNEAPQPRVRKSDRTLLGPGEAKETDPNATRKKRPPKEAKKEPPKRVAKADTEGDAPQKGEKKPTPSAPTEGEPRERVAKKKGPELHEGEGPFAPGAEDGGTKDLTPPGGDRVGGVPNPPESVAALLPASMGPVDQARKEGSIDHIEDVDKGAQTMLNTREYKHAWFFNRVKNSVQKRWHAVDAHRRHDPYGRVYGVRDRLTVVQVTLDREGGLEDIFVTKDSGVVFLDEVALQAFREAQPFPNPPDDLIDGDGRITFRFSFYLEINGRAGFRLMR